MKKIHPTFHVIIFVLFSGSICHAQSLEELKTTIEIRKEKIEELNKELNESEEQIATLSPDAKRTEVAKAKKMKLLQQNRQYQLKFADLEKELNGLRAILRTYKDQFKPRYDIKIGQVFETIKGPAGNNFNNAKVVNITPDIRIQHGNGISIINPKGLPSYVLEKSVLAPLDEDLSEYNSSELKKRRPVSSLTYSKRVALAREDRENAKLQAETDLKNEQEARRLRAETLALDRINKKTAADAKRVADEKERNEFNDNVNRKIRELENLNGDLRSKISSFNNLRSDKIRTYSLARIKPDKIKHQRTLTSIDKSIGDLNSAIGKNTREISSLRSSLK